MRKSSISGWGGCETGPFPSFSRRGWLRINKNIPFLGGADGREARAR